MRSIRRILGISWLDKVTNADFLSRAGLPSTSTLLRQRILRWLGHVHRKDDVWVRYMKAVDIDTMSWEGLAADRTHT